MSVEIHLALVILLALYFAYTDGFQVGSAVPAAAIGCRALSPIQAVAIAATCEMLGALFGGSAVAQTVAGITTWPARADLLPALVSGLAAACLWNHAMRWFNQPSSSTHALFGGIIGAVLVASGRIEFVSWGAINSVIDSSGVCKVVISLLLSPLLGIAAGYISLKIAMLLLMRASTRITPVILRLQWLAVAALAFCHGANDSQKAMGLIILALKAGGIDTDGSIPMWVRASTGVAIAFGVIALAPGIVKRVGNKIFPLRPLHGLMSQTSAATIIFSASAVGGPVSTTQVIASSVMGVGSAARLKGVDWAVAQEIFLGWFLTIPGAAILATLIHLVVFNGLLRGLTPG